MTNALNTISQVNEFKKLNSEFSLTEFKNYLKSIKVKNANGVTINILSTSNICKKSTGRKLTWIDNNPINYLQLENVITLSGLYMKHAKEKYMKHAKEKYMEHKKTIVDSAETEAYITIPKVSFWNKIKNFFTK